MKLLNGLAFALTTSLIAAMDATGWSQRSIYQIVTDRFALSDGSTPDCGLRTYCGGTWKGIRNKLDYISGMGFDAIWISPIIHNLEENTTWGYGYHGYWGANPFKLNDHFGTAQDLLDLSDALHDRNMSLMVDFVINHLAINQIPSAIDYSRFPEPFNNSAAFHPNCPINYDDQSSVENCWLVDSQPPLLADVNSENPKVLKTIIQSVVDLVQKFSIDGIRLDTARHVPKRYLSQFQQAVGVFVTGEVLSGDVEYVASYQGSLESVLNYPLYFQTIKAFTGESGFNQITSVINDEDKLFLNASVLCNFLDNHDQPRLASKTGLDVSLDMNAAAFILLTSGIPVIYYGFEQRFNGAVDPENREPLWPSKYNQESSLYQFLSKLHKIKYLTNLASTISQGTKVLGYSDSFFAFQRGPLIVVVTNVGQVSSAAKIYEKSSNTPSYKNAYQLNSTNFPSGAQIVDLISCQTTTTGPNGSISGTFHHGMPRVWADLENAHGFCSG